MTLPDEVHKQLGGLILTPLLATTSDTIAGGSAIEGAATVHDNLSWNVKTKALTPPGEIKP